MSKKIATISIVLIIISIIIGIGIGTIIARTHKGDVAEYHNATVDLASHLDLNGLAVRGDWRTHHQNVRSQVAAKHQVLHLDV